MNSRISFIATMLTILAASALAQQSVLVGTENLSKREFHDQVTLVGRSEAKIRSRIVAEISGKVISIDAAEGNPIKKNQTLISIDPSFKALELKAAQAEVDEAAVELKLANTNFQRKQDLRKRNLISETTLDSSHAFLNIYSARLARLTAIKDKIALDFENCRIKAPFSGHTLRRLVDVGEWVEPGTAVYEMIDLSEIYIIVDLPQKYYSQLAMNARADITIAGNGDGVIAGQVTGIAREASAETHTFEVIITIANPDEIVGSGELVRATLSLEGVFTDFAVSKDAIIRDGAKTMIYTINDGKASPVPVITTSTDGEYIAISGGMLTEGMPIVIRGNERIFPGMDVRTADGDEDGADPAGQSNDETAETTDETTSDQN